MTALEWKECMKDFVDGVDRELRSTTPMKSRGHLRAFRERLVKCRTARDRKRFDRDLETLLGSKSYLRAAAKSYLRKRAIPALAAATAAANQVVQVLAKALAKQGT